MEAAVLDVKALKHASRRDVGACIRRCRVKASVGLTRPSRESWRSWRGTLRAIVDDEAQHEEAETQARKGWDPEGLFTQKVAVDFSRKGRKAPTMEPAPGPLPQSTSVTSQKASTSNDLISITETMHSFTFAQPIRPLPYPGVPLPAGQDAPGYSAQELSQKLRDVYIPVDLSYPGMKVLHLDPVVLLVEEFISKEDCEELIQAAEASGCLQASKIGSGNIGEVGGDNTYHMRRTSRSMLADVVTQAQYPIIGKMVKRMQQKARAFLDPDNVHGPWGGTGRLPSPGQYCYESCQIASYNQGQFFLSHEDGFPDATAAQNKFQRHATLLLYLNDVGQGGHTCFDHLGLAVQPRQGSALLFFPAFADGKSDERSLHTAMDAIDTKWVMQQWIARGWVRSGAEQRQKQAVGNDNEASVSSVHVVGTAKSKKRAKTGNAKGFGKV